ncbi:MAG: Holliday junction resolvase RuvX [Candidatus Moraniibacteriota bacterium]
MEEIKNYLGIDWGQAKIGLALADGETKMAFAYGALKNDKNIVSQIVEVIKKEDISVVVMGVPVYFNQEGKTFLGKKMAQKIKEATGAEIIFQNEIFSTQSAQKNLIESGAKKISLDDAEAARVILESYLDNVK